MTIKEVMTLTKERFISNWTRGKDYFALEVKDYTQETENRGKYTLEVIKISEEDLQKYNIDEQLSGDCSKQPPVVRLK